MRVGGVEVVPSVGYYMFITVSGPAVMERLVGGTSPHEGRMELRLYNQWGAIFFLYSISDSSNGAASWRN